MNLPPLLLAPDTFRRICRTCLQTQDLLFSIDDVKWENISLRKVLSSWISFEKNFESEMPQNICKMCVKQAYSSQYFLKRAQKSQSMLSSVLNHKHSQPNKIEYIEIIDVKEDEENDRDTAFNDNFDSDVSIEENSKEISIEPVKFMMDLDSLPQTKDYQMNNMIKQLKKEKSDIQDIKKAVNEKMKLAEHTTEDNQTKFELQGDMSFPYTCSVCKRGFDKHADILLHKKVSKHRGIKYSCPYCHKVLKTRFSFDTHTRIHTKERPYVCSACGMDFSDNSCLRRHVRFQHSENPTYQCKYCDEEFKRQDNLKIHESKHDQTKDKVNINVNGDDKKKIHVCFCGKTFNKFRSWKCHEKQHRQNELRQKIKESPKNSTEESQKRFICNICGKMLFSMKILNDHIAMMHGPKNLPCDSCDKKFSIESQLQRHKYNAHTKSKEERAKKRFICNVCGKSVASLHNLNDHLAVQHGPKDIPCDICGKMFGLDSQMKKHKNFVHSVGKFTCEICGHTVKQKDILDEHVKRIHGGETQSYKCEFCEKAFSFKSSLRHHLRIHTNDTKYQCKVCFKICTTKRNLGIHMRVHTGERAHECPQCGKKFAAKENLNLHLKVHNNEPPTHHCSICPRSFYRNCLLQKHIRQAHKTGNSRALEKAATRNEDFLSDEGSDHGMDLSFLTFDRVRHHHTM